MVRAVSPGKLSSFREGAQLSGLDLLLAEDEGPKQDLSQKLCCFGQEGGWLSGAKDGAASKLCGSHLSQKLLASVFYILTHASWPPWSPGTKVAPTEPEAEASWGRSDTCALTRKVVGCLEPKMAPPQKLCGSRLPQKLLASAFHTLTCADCPLRSLGTKVAPTEPEAEASRARRTPVL